MSKKKKKKDDKKASVHKDLKGLDLKINEFGAVESNIDISKINEFLNKNLKDKKFEDEDSEKNDDEDENNGKDKKDEGSSSKNE